MDNKNILDLFCGAGGLSLGFEKCGFKVIRGIDFNRKAIETYNYNRENKCGQVLDITKIDDSFYEGLESVVGIIGGPPCQGFSTAGKREHDDVRNSLYKEYFKILSKVKPCFFVIENVTGILNYKGGEVIEDIFKKAKKAGYKIFGETLNAVDYGVPQFRKRVFFVGIRKDIVNEKGRFIFPEPLKASPLTISDAISDLPEDIKENQPEYVGYLHKPQNDYQKELREGVNLVANHNFTKHTKKTIDTIKMVPEGGSIKDLSDDQKAGRNYHALLRKMDRNKPSLTIDTGHRTYFHYNAPRIPSVREVARLQSFPDSFIFIGPKAEQYRQVGNAVPPKLAYAIAKSIERYMKGDK